MNKVDYYSILGISKNATAEDIKKAYRLLVKKYHPDRNSSPISHVMMIRINEACEVLGDKVRRDKYDKNNNLQNINHSKSHYEYETSYYGYSSSSGSGPVILLVGFILFLLIGFAAFLSIAVFNSNHDTGPKTGTLSDMNNSPTSSVIDAVSQSATVRNNESVSFSLTNDSSPQSMYDLADIITSPLHGTLGFANEHPTVDYTPHPDYVGHDIFKFIIRNYKTGKVSNIGIVSIIVDSTPQMHSMYQNRIENSRI